jgi:predicted sulfurtransferase
VKAFITACLFAGFIVLPARADIIYFKDGMKTICEGRAWEEKDEVKCEYSGWVLTYQKKDVLRIIKTTPNKNSTPTGTKADSKKSPPEKNTKSASKKSTRAVKQAPPTKKSEVSQTVNTKSVRKKIMTPQKRPTGPVFYDPRRPYKYWADKDSRHKNYKQAIQALAKKYSRTPEWIQSNMGDTNDLGQIHRNLSNPQAKSIDPKSSTLANQKPEVLFYNPRRPYPYQTGKKSKHKSFKAAIQALAKTYDRSPEWVKQNMGATNDLNEIHGNLKARRAMEP